MMKLIVFSDSHRRNSSDMLVIIDEEKPDAVLHLGDVVDDADDIRSVYPDLKVYNVRGNNDYGWRAQDVQDNLIVCAGQVKLFLTHGHLYGVRRNTKALAAAARRHDCQMALYGHTHEAEIDRDGGILIANPGSISLPYVAAPPSYLRLVIEETDIQPEIIYLAQKR